MHTDSRELTEKEIYERDGMAGEFEKRYGMKIIRTESNDSSDSYANLKNVIFMAVVMGMGTVVWTQQSTNATFSKQIAVLQVECRNNTQQRNSADNKERYSALTEDNKR